MDWPKKKHKSGRENNPNTTIHVGSGDESGTKEQDSSAIKKHRTQKSSRAEHGIGLELNTSQLLPLDGTVLSEFPAGYETGNVSVEDIGAKWL